VATRLSENYHWTCRFFGRKRAQIAIPPFETLSILSAET